MIVKRMRIGPASRAHTCQSGAQRNQVSKYEAFCLILTFLFASLTSANAATIHRSEPIRLPVHERVVVVRPDQRIGAPGRFAVPGWSAAQTQQWLNSASAASGLY
jgi:hypothetical protein